MCGADGPAGGGGVSECGSVPDHPRHEGQSSERSPGGEQCVQVQAGPGGTQHQLSLPGGQHLTSDTIQENTMIWTHHISSYIIISGNT